MLLLLLRGCPVLGVARGHPLGSRARAQRPPDHRAVSCLTPTFPTVLYGDTAGQDSVVVLS